MSMGAKERYSSSNRSAGPLGPKIVLYPNIVPHMPQGEFSAAFDSAVRIAARLTDSTAEGIVGGARTAPFVRGRHLTTVSLYLGSGPETRVCLKMLGQKFGRDHTTVGYGVARFISLYVRRADVRRQIEEMAEGLGWPHLPNRVTAYCELSESILHSGGGDKTIIVSKVIECFAKR